MRRRGLTSALVTADGPDQAGDVREVPTVTLDDYAERAGQRGVRMLKVDVEGAEPRVLAGARRLLAAQRPELIVEVIDAQLQAQGSSREELPAFLASLGYEAYGFTEDGPRRLGEGAVPEGQNLYFVHRGPGGPG